MIERDGCTSNWGAPGDGPTYAPRAGVTSFGEGPEGLRVGRSGSFARGQHR